MGTPVSRVIEFLGAHESWALGVSLFSIFCFVASLAAVPILVARAPVDYFVASRRHEAPLLRKIARNLLGGMLLVAGVLMLVLPGQGMLTLLAALCLLDFPGKRGLVRRMVQRPRVASALQWLRRRAQKPPFELP